MSEPKVQIRVTRRRALAVVWVVTFLVTVITALAHPIVIQQWYTNPDANGLLDSRVCTVVIDGACEWERLVYPTISELAVRSTLAATLVMTAVAALDWLRRNVHFVMS